MAFKPNQSIEICMVVISCIFLCGSTVDADCSPEETVACISDTTEILNDYVNHPRSFKMQGLCDAVRQTWACLNAHNCDVSEVGPSHRRVMELCNGHGRAADVGPACSVQRGLDCVRDAGTVASDFVKNPQYDPVSMRRLCNAMRDMRNCLRANRCYIEGLEANSRRLMQQCNAFFRGGYSDGSILGNRAKRAAEFGGGILQSFVESASEALLSFKSEE